MRRLRSVVLRSVVVAVVAGVVGGVAARLLMRAMAEVSHATTSFSVAGSAIIIAVFVVALLPGAVAAVISRGWPRWLLLGAGTLLLAFAAAGTARSDLDSALILTTYDRVMVGVVLCLFALIFVGQPILAARVADRLGSHGRRNIGAVPSMDSHRGAFQPGD